MRGAGMPTHRLSESEFPLEMGGTAVKAEKPQQLRPRGTTSFFVFFSCRDLVRWLSRCVSVDWLWCWGAVIDVTLHLEK